MDSGFLRFRWGPLRLEEAFASEHQWGKRVHAHGVCSSYSSKRCTWIDMLWHSTDLRVGRRSVNTTPAEPMPNAEHGSDHLPIFASFDFVR